MNVFMLRGLESAGWAEFSRDEERIIKGMKIKASGVIPIPLVTMSGPAAATRRERDQDAGPVQTDLLRLTYDLIT
jgi:hypothetical protein